MSVLTREFKNIFRFILCSIIFCLFVLTAFPQKIDVNISSGICQSSMNWSIAGNYSDKSIEKLSELRWERLKVKYFDLSLNYKINEKFRIISDFEYRHTIGGFVRDVDYGKNGEIMKDETFNSNKGNGNTYTIGLQHNILVGIIPKFIDLSIHGSYHHKYQEYIMMGYDDYYTNLNSFYKNAWNGIDIGLVSQYHKSKYSIKYKVSSRFLSYSAKADWNLIDSYMHPISFVQYSKGFSFQNDICVSYTLNGFFRVFTNFRYSEYMALRGSDYLYYNNGNIGESRLNGVDEKLMGIGVGVSVRL